MILTIDTEGAVALIEAVDLKAFKVSGRRPTPAARRRLVEAGVDLADDDAHAFIAADTLKHLAEQSGPLPADWLTDFEAMVAYATTKGWTDEQGRLRAHTEWQD